MSTCRRSCGTEPGPAAGSDTGNVSVRIRRVTTTRAGGVSAPPFDSFNLGDHVGDDPAAVAQNRRRLAAAVGADALVWMNQVHSDHVVTVDGPRDTAVDNADALVTTTPGLALVGGDRRLCPGFNGRRARRGRRGRPCRTGRRPEWHRGQDPGGDAGRRCTCRGHVGAARSRRSAAPTTRCPNRWRPKWRRCCPASRTSTSRGTPGLDLRAGIARQLTALGVTAIDVDPRCTVADRSAVQSSPGCTDRAPGECGVDGDSAGDRCPDGSGVRCEMSTVQRGRDADRTAELTAALGAARGAPGARRRVGRAKCQ